MPKELALAYAAYWQAKLRREEWDAYCKIKLFGGQDGFAREGWRAPVVRWLRRLAYCIERG
jgi:hypothetical protein